MMHWRRLISVLLFYFFMVFSTLSSSSQSLETEVTLSKWYGVLGCINITSGWYDPVKRPFNLLPEDREVVDTEFKLFTCDNELKGQILSVEHDEDIRNSNFDPRKLTIFIVHGFLTPTTESGWVKDMRLELLKHKCVNVVVVDWTKGSIHSYTQATANTLLVGKEIVYIIKHLKDNYGLDPKDVEIIGHSLGAHIAGYAGKGTPHLGRITGMDPAGPYFSDMPQYVRLVPSDAILVVVIYTDRNGFGLNDLCGHLNFYPNDGTHQPGCKLLETLSLPSFLTDGILEATTDIVACNHLRVLSLYTEAINSLCPFIGFPCSDYNSFKEGKCFPGHGDDPVVMGVHTQKIDNSSKTKHFFVTEKDNPFCVYHYWVKLELAKPPKANESVKGQITMKLFGEKTTLEVDLGSKQKFEHGTCHMFLTTARTCTGTIYRADVTWDGDVSILSIGSLLGSNDHLYVTSVTVDCICTTDVTGYNLSKPLRPGESKYGDLACGKSLKFS